MFRASMCPSSREKTFVLPCIPESHPHRITSNKCRINTVVSLDDGYIVTRNMQRSINIQRINCVPNWFNFTRLYRDTRSIKHKILWIKHLYLYIMYTYLKLQNLDCVSWHGREIDLFVPKLLKLGLARHRNKFKQKCIQISVDILGTMKLLC
jgi:hypothetical protein